jgi:hypothetical protein
MSGTSDDPEREALGERHLAPVMAYMARNNVSRIQLTIEKVDANHQGIPDSQAPGVLVLSSHPSLEDDSAPSDLGLGGAFIVVEGS